MTVKNYSQRSHRSITEIHVLESDHDILMSMVGTVSELIALERSVMDQKSSRPAAAASSDSKATDVQNPCVVCIEEPIAPKTLRCGHTFCTDCIDKWFKTNPACPTCSEIQGIRVGDQPVGGTMEMTYSEYCKLWGFESTGFYTIYYRFSSGKQTVNEKAC